MKKLLCVLLIPVFSLCSCFSLFAEGTKQILLSDAGHGKIQVRPATNNFAWYSNSGSATEPYRLHIHVANAGEIIYYGFGDPINGFDNIANNVNYRIKDPNGTVVVGPSVIPLSGTGHINTFNEAVAGPEQIVGTSGYDAFSYTPALTGDYFIEFNFSQATHERIKFRYFDITVASAANVAIDGRVWSKAWQMTADDYQAGGGYTFWGKLYPYSDDGIVTSINFNGMEPFVFVVSCNPWGCYNSGVLNDDRRSVTGNHTLTKYKIFLNDPDSLVYPTGILGDVVLPIVITPDCDGTASIQVDVTKAGSLDILLDLNPLPGKQAEDVEISWNVNAGINLIPWNGLNGLGQLVSSGTSFNIVVTYINGLTNLPIFDVEANSSGFVVELKRPSGPIPTVFWDDILIGGTQNFTGCNSVLPSTGCHTWGYNQGNDNTVNTWWHAVDTIQSPVVFIEHRKPDAPGPITGPPALCPGASGMIYWIHKEVNSTGYIWGYTGTGATITQINDTTISVNYANYATSGNITVSGNNVQCGAGPAQTKAITVYPAPVVSLASFTPVCINAAPFTLAGGSPAGGTYTIGGTPVIIFNPAAYGAGTFTVTYTYTDPNTNCTAFSTKDITVNPLPLVTLAALTNVCISVPPFALAGGTPSGGTYSGSGVTAGIFSPAAAGAGTWNITYTYTDANGCVNSATKQITVYPLPVLSFPALSPVCITAAPFPLTGATPAGGTYKGPGVTAGIFYPAVAGSGIHTLKYLYTNSNGCSDSITQTITVNPMPGTPGSIAGPPVFCQSTASTQYSVPPIPDALTYVWTISPSSSGNISGSGTDITIAWKSSFFGTVILFVKGVNACGDGPVSQGYTITINPKPMVSYTLCSDSVTTTSAKPFQLKGGVPLNGTFSGSGVNSTTGIFTPSTAGAGTHPIQYFYINSYGCSGTASKNIIVVGPPSFSCGGKIKDVRDNKQYNTVDIGTQCWMSENLNYGKQISSDSHQRDNCVIEKHCYGDVTANCTNFGGLYQWDELMQYSATAGKQGLCMPGWHIPTEAEWNLLFSNYVNNGFAGMALKSTGFSGFNALLKGVGFLNRVMVFDAFASFFWSSNSDGPYKAWSHGMNSYNYSVSYYPSSRSNVFPVRCLKD